EKAARGADGRRYPWGDGFDAARCNSAEAGNGGTTTGDAHSPNGDSIHGCADMVGNVWEWTSTIWGLERSRPQFGPPYRTDDGRDALEPSTPFRELRVCRGGSYRDTAERVTCYARGRR